MTTDTPRTDAVEYNSGRVKLERFAFDADWARDMERENARLSEMLAQAHSESKRLMELWVEYLETTRVGNCVVTDQINKVISASLANTQDQTRT